ncbi:MAG: hypothetical protein GX605_02815 [Chloroflexi bacterium]|nr:hypothetical protein [Chloroflexota bacterium]
MPAMLKTLHAAMISIALLFLAGCQPSAPACPPAAHLNAPPTELATPTPAAGPVSVAIGRRSVLVDKVVSGPLCHDAWSGAIYVTCDVQVLPWEGRPTFLDGCALHIEPGTAVYVAHHNNAAYYNGCSCHTSTSAP